MFLYMPGIGLVSTCLASSELRSCGDVCSPDGIGLRTEGSASKGRIRVFNGSPKPLPMTIVVSPFDVDETGGVSRQPVDRELRIFPSRTIMPPGAAQTFQVRWVGDPQIGSSRNYILSIDEAPQKWTAGRSGIQVVFSFDAIVNVAPMTGSSAIKLLNSSVVNDESGKPRPMITVQNPGNVYARLSDATITLSGSGWLKTVSPKDMHPSMGVGLVQPGKKRRFLLPVELPPNVTDVTASINYQPVK